MSTVLVDNIAPTTPSGHVDLKGFRFLELLLGSSTFRGDWLALTTYALKDIVISSDQIYRCTVAHTSGATFESSNWEKVYLETYATVASDYTAIAIALG